MSAFPLSDLSHDIPVLGPIGVGIGTLGTTWAQVLADDRSRRGVAFYNPGANNLFVCPSNLNSQPATGAGAFLVYPQEIVEMYAEDEHTNINCAWMAWVSGGSNQPVSILNFTGANSSVAPPTPLASLNQGSGISSPLASGVLLSASVTVAIGANPVRRGIAFHNPGTVPVSVCPSNLSVAYGVAGSIIILPGQTRELMAKPRARVRVNCAWNAAAQSGSNNPLTVLEYLG